jgi:hypothetical protein
LRIVYVLLLLALAGACQATDMSTMEKSIKDIKAEHESQLMAMPGVVSVGLGQDTAGDPVIIIGVESVEHSRALALPRELQEYPVKIQVIGTISTQ